MTRRGRIRSRGELDLAGAFRFLGQSSSRRKLGLVADLLRESGVDVTYGEEHCDLAVANGASVFDALDLASVVAYGVEALTTRDISSS